MPTTGSEAQPAPVSDEVRRVLAAEAAAIASVADTVDLQAVGRLVDLLVHATGRVATMGCGTSGVAAKKIAHTLSCVGCAASFVTPSDAPHGALGVLREGDIVVLVSKGGNTGELVGLLPNLRAIGVTIVAITAVADSRIGTEADILIEVAVDSEPDPLNMLATASTLAVMAVMDAVAICVMQRNGFSAARFGLIHPGGAVGERLTATAGSSAESTTNRTGR